MPALIDRQHPAMRAAATAYRRVFGRAPQWVRSGGSIPVVSEFARVLGIPTVLMGFRLAGRQPARPEREVQLEEFSARNSHSVGFLE